MIFPKDESKDSETNLNVQLGNNGGKNDSKTEDDTVANRMTSIQKIQENFNLYCLDIAPMK